MNKFSISYLIPLIIPVIFSRVTQDPFLFPKETAFVVLAGLTFFGLFLHLIRSGAARTMRLQASDAALAGLLLLSVGSLYRTSNFYVTLEPVAVVISAFVLFFYLKVYKNIYQVFGTYLGLFTVSSLGAAGYAYLQYYRVDPIFDSAKDLDKMRLFSFFGNKNYLSEFLVIMLFVLAAKIMISLASARGSYFPRRACGKFALAFYSFSFVLTAAMVYLLQSRASFLAAAGGLLITLYAYLRCPSALAVLRSRGGIIALLAALCIAGAALYTFNTPVAVDTTDIFQRISSIFEFTGERNISIRLDIWHISLKMIRDNFWFGCGLAYFKMNYLDYQGILFREGKNRFYENQFFAKANQAHNEFLQIFCELGFAGFAVFTALIVFLFARLSRMIRVYSTRRSPVKFFMSVCLVSSFFSAVINSMFGFPLHILPTAILLVFLLAAFDLLSKIAASDAAAKQSFQSEYLIDPKKLNVVLVLFSIAIFYSLIFTVIPGYVRANSNMKAGLDLIKLKRPEMAFPYLKKSIAINRFNGEARYYLGICHMQRREYDRAIIEFLQALETESDPNIYSNIGLSYYKIGMYPEALEYMKKALDLVPSDIYYLLNAGCAEQRMKKFDSALAYFQKAQSFASSPEALINIGHVYLLLNMPQRGSDILFEALNRYGKDNKFSPKVYYLLGLCLGESKKYAEAISYIKKACDYYPDNNEYSINMGLYQIFAGLTSEAELTLRQSLRKDFDTLAAYNLANLYYNSSRHEDALILLKKIKSDLEEKDDKASQLYKETVSLMNLCRRGPLK